MATRFLHEGEVDSIDFDDEAAVLAEVASALDLDPKKLKIKESHLTGFDAGTVYEITTRGGKNGKEWCVVAGDEEERELALAIAKQDLEESPENFNQDFIERHIDMDRLKRELHQDVFNMAYEDLEQMDEKEIVKLAEEYGVDQPPDEDDEDANEFEWDLDELAEKITEDKLKDPMAYLSDFGEDAVKRAIEIAGIDVDAAAEDAVDTDGAAHFLSSYDSNSYTTKGGLVYWRQS